MTWISAALAVVLVSTSLAAEKTIFIEKFDDGDAWESRWDQSEAKSDYGKFVLSSGDFYGDVEKDKGMKTSEPAKFYSRSASFPEAFDNKDKPLVVQFTVKHEQNIDCGGGYVKVFDCSIKPKEFHSESPYKIMFGPDICGPGTRKVHVILDYKGEQKMIKKEIRAESDEFTHLYTLKLLPDNTYEVYVDNKMVENGSLEDDFDFLPPRKIKDPEAKKPEDWDDNAKIDDPEDSKPEDWDVPEHIADPDATKPEDWDDDMDGEWEPPMVDNPDFKGEWKPKQIDNPNYKGVWIHPEIDNPDYKPDDSLYHIGEICSLGFDLWQVKSGTIFDNILVTSDPEEAKEMAKDVWEVTKEAEKTMREKQKEEEEATRKAKEESEAANSDEDEDVDAEEAEDGHDEL